MFLVTKADSFCLEHEMDQFDSCNSRFEGCSSDYKNRLLIVIFLNAVMFCVGLGSGHFANSQALQADALDFFGDAVTCSFSLLVIGSSIHLRSKAAQLKAIILVLIGSWVLFSTLTEFSSSIVPRFEVMGLVSCLAFFVNFISLMLLMKYKNGDANVRSVWLCFRNDALGNVSVMISAFGVWMFQSNIPDLLVGLILSGCFLSSAFLIFNQAFEEQKEAEIVSAK